MADIKHKISADQVWPESIMIAPYPAGDEKAFDPEAERIIESMIELVHSIRNARAEHKVESNKWIEAHIFAGELAPASCSILRPYKRWRRLNHWSC